MSNLLLLACFAVADLAAAHFGSVPLEVAGALELAFLAKAADGIDLGIMARARRVLARQKSPAAEQ